jgi:hypothetical protein
MEYVIVFGLMFILIGFISWRWVVGIDYMQKNHPNYKGEDFLNSAGRDGWDEDLDQPAK